MKPIPDYFKVEDCWSCSNYIRATNVNFPKCALTHKETHYRHWCESYKTKEVTQDETK